MDESRSVPAGSIVEVTVIAALFYVKCHQLERLLMIEEANSRMGWNDKENRMEERVERGETDIDLMKKGFEEIQRDIDEITKDVDLNQNEGVFIVLYDRAPCHLGRRRRKPLQSNPPLFHIG